MPRQSLVSCSAQQGHSRAQTLWPLHLELAVGQSSLSAQSMGFVGTVAVLTLLLCDSAVGSNALQQHRHCGLSQPSQGGHRGWAGLCPHTGTSPAGSSLQGMRKAEGRELFSTR